MHPLFAEVAAGDMTVITAVVELVTRLGLPAALLFIVLRYHVRVIVQKDAEIQRVSELRVKESRELNDAMLKRDREFLDVMGETNQTLALFNEKLK